MQDKKKDFRDKMERVFVACSDWLREEAPKLADALPGGCTDWHVSFDWQSTELPDGFPRISVTVNKVPLRVVDAYVGYDTAEECHEGGTQREH